MEKLKAWLQLMRLPAVFTAISNVATGFFAVSQPPYAWGKLALLCASSACLYTAGMVLNDYSDRELDARERPNRPIPSGRILAEYALLLAQVLFVAGVLLPGFSNAIVALLGVSIILYVRIKRLSLFMALCRFLNVLLGASVIGQMFDLYRLPLRFWFFPSAVTLWTLAIMWFSKREVERPHYQKIIKKMILGFIVLDAIFVTFLAGPIYGLAVLSLLVPSVLLARWIYVT